jgi:hypothetical protein
VLLKTVGVRPIDWERHGPAEARVSNEADRIGDEHEADRSGDELAYEPNWYRMLKALSEGNAVELGEAPDPEIAFLVGDPEADRPAPVRVTDLNAAS